MDPYRDSNLISRVSELEAQVEKLKQEAQPPKKTILKGLREALHDGFKSGTFFLRSGIFGILLAWVLMFPALVNSCGETPEEIRAHQEIREAEIERHKSSCEAMNMKLIDYHQGAYTNTLTCGNESMVLIIDLHNHTTETHALHDDDNQ